MVYKLTKIATSWNRVLHYSGGSLNLQKCGYHLTIWEWNHGRPTHRKQQQGDPKVKIHSMATDSVEEIKYQEYDQASRILGVYLAPSGDFTQQLEILQNKADVYANRLQSPRLCPDDIITFIRTTYIPSMNYVLPCIAVDEEELQKVQSKLLSVALQKLGLSSKTPVSLRHGPIDMGGLDLPDLRTEIGISQLRLMRNAIFKQTEVGKLILLSVKYSQIEAGIHDHILERPDIEISYMSSTWVTSVRQYLYQHNLTITLSDSLRINFQGHNDKCIMQPEALIHFSKQQKFDINLVRLHLQAITLSDLSEPDGQHIRILALQGSRSHGETQRVNWPRQPPPTKYQVNLWKQYLTDNFLQYKTKWKRRLDQPIHPNTYSNHKEKTHSEPKLFDDPRQYHSLRQYIKSLPRWHQRLVQNYQQIATELEIWRAFRKRGRTIDIASDGGLANKVGTFGWKIVTTIRSKEVTLFQGSGPIDGPAEIGSSTRSELGGFTAPILLVTTLAKFWGIRHRCRFRWYTDSKSAISKVRIYVIKGKAQKFPENSDYITTLTELIKELHRPVDLHWVKGHQDDDRQYDQLPREARLNVDADGLATQQYQAPRRQQPMRSIDHLSSQRISLTINGRRFPSNWDTNLRWSINASYMKQSLMAKHNWSESVWSTIDFAMVKAYLTHKSIHVRHKWFKFMHDLQPLGQRKQRMSSPLVSTQIDLCPCCQVKVECQLHLITCVSNPNYTEAWKELTTGGSPYKENHNAIDVISDCLQQWLKAPERVPTQRNNNPYSNLFLPSHMQVILAKAIIEQSAIGWANLLRGYLSSQWKTLASSHMLNSEMAASNKTDGCRRLGTVLQRIQGFLNQLWQGRNDVLHKHDTGNERKFQSIEAAEIRHFYTQPHLLPARDQHYCDCSLLQLLRSRPAHRRRWLMRVRRARAELLSDQHRQVQITSYFTRQKSKDHNFSDSTTHPAQVHPPDHRQYTERRATPTTRSAQKVQHFRNSSSRQTKLTHFFPGRPPDSTKTSNPTNKSPASD